MGGIAVLLCSATPGHGEDLLAIYDVAHQNDPKLQQAEATYQADLEVRPQSRALLLPDFNFSVNTTDNDQNRQYQNSNTNFIQQGQDNFNSHGYQFNITQPLFNLSSFVQYQQAGVKVQQAADEVMAARQDLIVRVAQAYFNVLAAQDDLEFAQSEKKADAQQLEQTKQQYKVGLIAITDVNEAQASYDLSVAQEIQAQNSLANAREALRVITGKSYDNLQPLGDKLPLTIPAPEDIEAWTKTALELNPQLRAAQHAAEVARQQVNLQRAGHYPTVDLLVNSGDSVSSGGSFGGNEIYSTSVGVQLNLPIFQGGLVSSKTREANDRFVAAQQTLEEQRRDTINQTRESYLGVTSNISLVKAYNQAIISNTSRLEATEAGLEVGTRTTVDVLNARRDLFASRRDYAQARYNYIVNILQLKGAAGTLTRNDLLDVNKWLQ
jgi:outer membrane protein